MEEKNLLVKFINKLKKMKKVAALGLTGLAISGTLSSCAPLVVNTDTTSPDSTITDTQTDVDEQKEYSQTLQTVLNDNYYKDVALKVNESIGKSYHEDVLLSGLVKPIPYSFLEQQGYDIEAIKNDEIECISHPYILENEPNNLYIDCWVLNENKADINYVDTYLLKYNLTDKEMSELQFLFNHLGNFKETYLQAPLFVQQLSYDKQAQVVGSGHMNDDTHTNIIVNNSLKSLEPNKIYNATVLSVKDYTGDISAIKDVFFLNPDTIKEYIIELQLTKNEIKYIKALDLNSKTYNGNLTFCDKNLTILDDAKEEYLNQTPLKISNNFYRTGIELVDINKNTASFEQAFKQAN